MTPEQEQGKDKFPEAHPGAPRDPRPLEETLLEAFDLLGGEAETDNPEPLSTLSNIQKLRALLAARERGEDIDVDELNRIRTAVQNEPIRPEEQ